MSSVAAGLDAAPSRAEETSVARARRRPSVAARRNLDAPTPWQVRDALVSLVLAIIGAAVVGLCWNGASKEAAFRDQVGWTVGAFLGCGVFALAGGYWLLVGFRRTRQCKAQLRADAARVFDVEDVRRADVRAEVEAELPASSTSSTAAFVTADAMRLAHRPDCLLVRGKAVRPIPVAEQDTYPKCGMCA